jgi:hypothetical protein
MTLAEKKITLLLEWPSIEDGKIINKFYIRIPFYLKDRRTRPYDLNGKGTETLYGTLKLRTKESHEFSEPNDPTLGVWTNFCLEDFALYWNLPNADGAKYVYFQQVNFESADPTVENDVFPKKNSMRDTIVQDAKEKKVELDKAHSLSSKFFGGLSGLCMYLYYLAI